MNPPLPLPADIPAIQQFAAHATHWVLYALLLVQPLVGWIGTSAYPAPVPVFGWFKLPRIWSENRAFSEQMMALHRWLGIAIALFAGDPYRWRRSSIISCAGTGSSCAC